MDNITKQAVEKIAKANGYEVAALLAVVDVESTGIPFWKVKGQKVPPIRFEGHYFYARLSDAKLDQAIKEGLASKSVGGVANPTSYADRYALLARAKRIDEIAAIESTSYGLGQVMGANWKVLGYPSAQAFEQASMTLEGQLEAMVRFLDYNGLKAAVNSHDWKTVALRYNGKLFKRNNYDTKLASAYDLYADRPTGQVSSGISQMQIMLNTVGEYKLTVDGKWGPNTQNALRDFQMKNGLKVDGVYGPITREALTAVYSNHKNKTTTNTGLSGSAVGTVGIAMTEAARQIEPLAQASDILQWVFVALILIGLALTVKGLIFKSNY